MIETDLNYRNRALIIEGELPDEALLDRVRAGETALYEVLVHRHSPSLRRAARRVLRDHADVEDVIQEVHYKALRYLEQFSGRASFSVVDPHSDSRRVSSLAPSGAKA